MMRTQLSLTAALVSALVSLGLPACSTAPETSGEKMDLHNESATALDKIRHQDPSLGDFLAKSYGYAIFPSVGKGGVVIGGAYGRGEVYENGTRVGYCDMSQATIGAQLGGQSYIELIAFENKAAMDHFKSGNYAFAAQASAVALHSGAASQAKYTDGVAIFTATNAGLMFEASVGGQKFSYQPLSL